ncbi:MAG: lysophospholipid acyltransferase family protein [Ilumatobacteraceae bacterium]
MAEVDSVLRGNSWGSRVFYSAIRFIVVVFCRTWLKLSVIGSENIPSQGAFILAPIHRSIMDIPIASGVTRRRMRFMGKDSLWHFKPLGAMFSALGAFPVTRGSADLEALKRCIYVITAGDPLVLFPEGTRQSGDTLQPLFDGAAYVAVKTQVPIVPVGIGGSEEIMPSGSRRIRRRKCVAVVGAPIYPSKIDGNRAARSEVRELTAKLAVELQTLFDEALKAARR